MTLRFGPSGNSRSCYDQGHKSTLEAAAWLQDLGLNAYEYSFGRGVQLREDTARAIGAEMARCGIRVSVHAPYFINLANPDPDKLANSFRYLAESVRVGACLFG